jgi:hypothetical protein
MRLSPLEIRCYSVTRLSSGYWGLTTSGSQYDIRKEKENNYIRADALEVGLCASGRPKSSVCVFNDEPRRRSQ